LKKIKLFAGVAFILVCGMLAVFSGNRTSSEDFFVSREEKQSNPTAETEKVKPDGSREVTEEEVPIKVFVCGAVQAEGVYALSAGSRVIDAIEAAGGFSEDASTSFLNLAEWVTDGIRVYVPTKDEVGQMTQQELLQQMLGSESESNTEKKVNLNKADKEQLMTLPGIGEAKAESIIAYRKNVGPFQTPEDITKVTGIGSAMYERIKDRITTEN